MISVNAKIAGPICGCSSSARSSTAAITRIMSSTALRPICGADECDGRPVVVRWISARPRPPRTICRSDASPITTKSAPVCSITFSSATPSSTSSITDALTTALPFILARSSPPIPCTIAASAPFMSAAPRPCSAPSRISPLNGSSSQGTPGETPTVSVCASKTIVGPGCAPSTTPTTLPTLSVHTLSNPSAVISSSIRRETCASSPLRLWMRTISRVNEIRRSLSNIRVSLHMRI